MIRINLLGLQRPKGGRRDSLRPSARMDTGKDRRPSLRMLADAPLSRDDNDLLGFKAFADAIAGVIDSPRTGTPFVLSINAEWGAGKTTLGRMVERRLREKPAADGNRPHSTCWFDAWMNEESATLATSLAAEVARQANSHRSLWLRFLRPLPSTLIDSRAKRIRKSFKYLSLFVAVLSTIAYLSYRLGIRLFDVVRFDTALLAQSSKLFAGHYQTVLPVLTALIVAGVLLLKALGLMLPIAKSVGEFVRDPSSSANTASMVEVRRQLFGLIKQATPKGSKFVIFIDDLDRCRPPRLIEVLEVVSQLLNDPGVVVVIMADMQVVARCAEITYRDLGQSLAASQGQPAAVQQSTYGWDYIQKVVQLQFDLPRHSSEKLKFLVGTLASRVPEETDSAQIAGGVLGLQEKVASLGKYLWRLIEGIARPDSYLESIVFAIAIVILSRFIWLMTGNVRVKREVVFFAGIVVGLVVVGLLLRMILKLVVNSRRRKIDAQIEEQIAIGKKDFSSVERSVRELNRSWRANPTYQGLIRERLQRYLEDESELQVEAEDEVIKHLVPLPRHAKRVLNRLRLFLFVAHERRMFGGEPKLTSRHIGKWAVLCERWPGLAQAIYREPLLVSLLEDAKTHKALIQGRFQIYATDREVGMFFLGPKEVKLGQVMERIIEFRSAND